MQIIQTPIDKNDCFRNNINKVDSRYTKFQNRGPVGLMLHSVGTPQPNAKVFANSWNRPNYEVAVHAVIQSDGTVYQCMPWNYRGWHAGGGANETHVGVEMAEPSEIKYITGANFICSDREKAVKYVSGCYKTAVELFAMLCKEYNLNPMKDIISHSEGYKKGIASGHSDPEHLWRGLGMSYTMDTFRNDVYKKMNSKDVIVDSEEEEEVVTKETILEALGDTFINTYADLPEWAKPEAKELIDAGALKGTKEVDRIEDTEINMLLSEIRVMIISLRMIKSYAGSNESSERFKEIVRTILANNK